MADVGGEARVDSAPATGTYVELRFPLTGQELADSPA
jgi:hypothetical protein